VHGGDHYRKVVGRDLVMFHAANDRSGQVSTDFEKIFPSILAAGANGVAREGASIAGASADTGWLPHKCRGRGLAS